MADWIFRIDNTDYPVESIDELRDKVRDGELHASHYVYNPTLQKWLYARDIEELKPAFDARSSPRQPSRLNKSLPLWSIVVILLSVGAWIYWDQPNPFGFDKFTFAPIL